jgi:signal transduction histidine kinase/CheY-like chemotaxis protein
MPISRPIDPQALPPAPRVRSFKTRLMLLVALAVTVPTLLASIYLGDRLERQARELYASRLEADLQTMAVLIKEAEEQLPRKLARMTGTDALRDLLERGEPAPLADQVDGQRQALDVTLLGVYAASDARPLVVARSDVDVGLEGLTLRLEGGDGRACVASRELLQVLTCAGKDYLVSVLPLYSNTERAPGAGERAAEGQSQLMGYLVGGAPLIAPELVASVHRLRLSQPIVWIDDRVVRSELTSSQVTPPGGDDSSPRRQLIDGAAYLGATRAERIGPRSLAYGVFLALGPLEARLRTALLTMAAFGLLLLTCTLVALNAITSRMSRPIRKLREGAALLGAGALEHRIRVSSGDELEALADQFNAMAERLQAARAELEGRVEERTREVAEKSRQLEIASRHKSEFLANMSHELRTPMNAIIGYSEMLQEDARAQHLDAMVPDLERIQSAARHLLGLINGVLDLSKIEAGKMDLYFEEVEVGQLVAEVASTIGPVVAKAGNTLRVRVPPELGWARTDVTKVRQVLFNLLGNAAKFTSGDEVELEVAREVSAAGDQLRLSVRDRGIGMSQEQVARLFQAFTQADASTTRKFGGTGLGLAITKAFVEMLGGTISVESTVGVGSTFTVRLPARAAGAGARDPEAAPAPRTGPQPFAEAPGQAPAVLVIDDDADVRAIMERLLLRDGYRPILAGGGAIGLELARRHHPAAITLDVLMPDMDGWCVLSALKADPGLAATPVVMLTIADDRRRAFALGATSFITKPLDHARMSEMLRRYARPGTTGVALIVDDDPLVRRMAREMLEREGWAVSEAVDGRAGLAQAQQVRPQLVLLDLMMPGMDGFEFIEQFRAEEAWRDIPVIVVTSKDLTAEDRRRLSGNVTRILAKGAQPLSEVLARLRLLIRTHAPQVAAAAPAEGRLDA